MKSGVACLLALVLLPLPLPAFAQWPENGSAACTAPYDQRYPKIAADGLGGVFVTWQDVPPTMDAPYHYVQKADASGVLWAGCGMIVCTEYGTGSHPQIVSDGSGGAILVWVDSRGGGMPIYAQRIDASGSMLWAAEGVPVCSGEAHKWPPQLCPDGAGGAVIAWSDNRNGDYDIFAQRIAANGTVMWTQDGVSICDAMGDQGTAYLVSDGSGGAIIAWPDNRSGDYDIFAQRIAANGTVQWPANGVPVCTASGAQGAVCIASDGAGGAIIAWDDARNDVAALDIFAQRLAGDGSHLWAADGIGVCVSPFTQNGPRIDSDHAGGAIIVWMDSRSSAQGIYGQRVGANGALQWDGAGAPICAADGWQSFPSIDADGLGGAVVAWEDDRNGDWDVYAQRVDASGAVSWGAEGVPVCTAIADQRYAEIASDGAGGAFVAWQDQRNDNRDIFVQYIPGEMPPLHVYLDIRPGSCPNPLNPKSRGVLPTAILGTSGLDVYDIDPATIELAGLPPLRWSYEDVSAPVADASGCACTDAGPDGRIDLTLKFDVPALVEKLGALEDREMVPLTVCGALHDGTAIEGNDCVRIVGGGQRKEKKGRDLLHIAVASPPTAARQRIEYTLSAPSTVEISMHDVMGRLVKRFDRVSKPAGTHAVEWNAAGLASGVYFCRVSAGASVLTIKIVLVR